MKNHNKKIISFIKYLFYSLYVLGVTCPALAQDITTDKPMFGNNLADKMRSLSAWFAVGVGFQAISLPGIIALLIFVVLSILSILFIALVFYGGYKWMMARGNEQEVEEARAIIRQAIIGLIVLLASYAFGYFILYYLITGGAGEGAPNTPYN